MCTHRRCSARVQHSLAKAFIFGGSGQSETSHAFDAVSLRGGSAVRRRHVGVGRLEHRGGVARPSYGAHQRRDQEHQLWGPGHLRPGGRLGADGGRAPPGLHAPAGRPPAGDGRGADIPPGARGQDGEGQRDRKCHPPDRLQAHHPPGHLTACGRARHGGFEPLT
eukprot:1190431-Prorocentrum_minimum.AAC.2